MLMDEGGPGVFDREKLGGELTPEEARVTLYAPTTEFDVNGVEMVPPAAVISVVALELFANLPLAALDGAVKVTLTPAATPFPKLSLTTI